MNEKVEIDLYDFAEIVQENKNALLYEEYNYMVDEVTYSDLEKGYQENKMVLQRKSDGKFFQVEYNTSPQHSITDINHYNPLIGYEVFQKTKTITYYE